MPAFLPSGRRLAAAVVALFTVALGLSTVGASQASEPKPEALILDVTDWERREAPTPDAVDGIGPGSYLLISINERADDGQEEISRYICSANYIWKDTSGTTYLGTAGHCVLPSGVSSWFGGNHPDVVKVEVCVALCEFGGQLGVLNGSFVDLGPVQYARQDAGDSDQIGKDFGLVTVPDEHLHLVRPQMPVWGGPTGAASEDAGPVCIYGNGVAVAETFATKGRPGHRDPADDARFGFIDDGGDGFAARLAGYGGDSGAGVTYCEPGGTALAGTNALGLITHGIAVFGVVPAPVMFGTTTEEAKRLVLEDIGLEIGLILADGSGAPQGTDPETSGAPEASFTTTCSGTTCTFDGSGSIDDGQVDRYDWEIDVTSNSGAVVTHDFGGGGRSSVHGVVLTVTDNTGLTDTATGVVRCSGSGKNRSCRPV